MRFIEEASTALPKLTVSDFIEFDLINDGDIFYDIFGETEHLANDSQSEIDRLVYTIGKGQTGNGL